MPPPSSYAVISVLTVLLAAAVVKLVPRALAASPGRNNVLLWGIVGFSAGCCVELLLEITLHTRGWFEVCPGTVWYAALWFGLAGGIVGAMIAIPVAVYWGRSRPLAMPTWIREAPYFAATLVGAIVGFVLAMVAGRPGALLIERHAFTDNTLAGVILRSLSGAILGAVVALLTRIARDAWPRLRAHLPFRPAHPSPAGRWQFSMRSLFLLVFVAALISGLLAWDCRYRKQYAIDTLLWHFGPTGEYHAGFDSLDEVLATVHSLGATEEATLVLLEALSGSTDEAAYWEDYENGLLREYSGSIAPIIAFDLLDAADKADAPFWVVRLRELRAAHWSTHAASIDYEKLRCEMTIMRGLAPEAVAVMIAVLEEHPDPQMRRAALRGLWDAGNLGTRTEPRIAAVTRVLDEGNPAETRREAALVIAWWRPENRECLPPLIAGLRDEDQTVRRAFALALTSVAIANRSAVPLLLEAAQDKNRDVRSAALWAISRTGPDAFVAVKSILEEMLQSESRWARIEAVLTVARFGPAARKLADSLRDLLTDEDEAVRRLVIDSLGRIGADEEATVAALADVVRDGISSKERCLAMEVLSNVAPESDVTLAVLRETCEDEDEEPGIRDAARQMLQRIGESRQGKP
ncbi:MAG: HEAT repeat domain-containing protein [Candidatus Nealsonbacteria bacterium]|nr:HEAT repeat domain-containing protein [Candidatus Nealsonbacteria bacterium]